MVRIGIIGCGYWGPNLIRNLSDIDETEVAGLCDLDESKLKRFSRKLPDALFTRDYKDLLKSKSIDAVVIATPANTHHKIAKDALQSGKHTLVEKPMTFNVEEALDIIETSKKQNKILMVGHTFEFNPAVVKIREFIEKGELGKIYYITSRRLNLGIIREDINAMWNLAPHDISILNFITGKMPIKVEAWGSYFLKDNHEDLVFMKLTYPEGIIANVHVSWLDPLKIRETVIVGSKKMILYDDVNNEAKLKLYDKGADKLINKNSNQGVEEFKIRLRAGDLVIPKINMTEPLKQECCHFIDCIINNKTPRTDGENGLRVVKVLTAAHESLKNGGKEVLLDQ